MSAGELGQDLVIVILICVAVRLWWAVCLWIAEKDQEAYDRQQRIEDLELYLAIVRFIEKREREKDTLAYYDEAQAFALDYYSPDRMVS